MKEIKIIIFILFVSIYSIVKGQIHHDILIEGMGGYSSFITDAETLHGGIGFGLGIGAGYELSIKKFKIRTGVEFTNLRPVLRMDNFIYDAEMLDTEGDPYLGHFHFADNKDRYSLGHVNIPLMFGAQFGRVYFLVGGKAGLNLFANSTTLTTLTTSGTYPSYIGDFENMPNHFFDKVDEKADYKLDLGLNYSVSLEIGTYLAGLGSSGIGYRISLFCDYGLKDVRQGLKTGDLMISKHPDYFQPVLNDFLLSNETKANLLFVGVKFAVVFGFDKESPCRCEGAPMKISTRTKRGKLQWK